MFTGIQVLSPRIFDYIPALAFPIPRSDVYPLAMRRGNRSSHT